MPVLLLFLVIGLDASAQAADIDLLDLIPPDSRIVTIERPQQFRGTPLANHWPDHPFGDEYPIESVDQVVSAFGIAEDQEEGFLLYLLSVDPIVLRGQASAADRIERVREVEILHFREQDGRKTAILGGSVLIWGDADPVSDVLELFQTNQVAPLPRRVRTTLAALRERTLTATWVMPPKYPYPADGPGTIGDRIELLVNQAYSTLRWIDGWIESHEEFVADSAENASLLAGLIRKVVQQGALLDEETQFSELLRRYHRNFGESARIIETGDAVRLSVRLSPAQVEKLRQETDNEAPETVNPEAPDDPTFQPSP
ncbi:MAG: hypothetical protein OXL36_15945 [Bryobacterales bacterium]|nr:hypothetical protein [Bryobacterales bacterium]MDE0295236.1 hypothetical protein [Bryobacterales bacterium]